MRTRLFLTLPFSIALAACGGSSDESTAGSAAGSPGAAGSSVGSFGAGGAKAGAAGTNAAGTGTAGGAGAAAGAAGSTSAGAAGSDAGAAGNDAAGASSAGTAGSTSAGAAGSTTAGAAGSTTAGAGGSSATAGSTSAGAAGTTTAGAGGSNAGAAGSSNAGAGGGASAGAAGSDVGGAAGAGGSTSAPPASLAIGHLSWDWGQIRACARRPGETATIELLSLGTVPSVLDYRMVTTHFDVPSGKWELGFVPSAMGCDGFPAKLSGVMDPGGRYTLLAGAVESHFVALIVDDVPPIPPPMGKAGGAFVRLFNGAPAGSSNGVFGYLPSTPIWTAALGAVGTSAPGNPQTIDANGYALLSASTYPIGAGVLPLGSYPVGTTPITFGNYVQSTIYALGTGSDPMSADPPMLLHCIETGETGQQQVCTQHPFTPIVM